MIRVIQYQEEQEAKLNKIGSLKISRVRIKTINSTRLSTTVMIVIHSHGNDVNDDTTIIISTSLSLTLFHYAEYFRLPYLPFILLPWVRKAQSLAVPYPRMSPIARKTLRPIGRGLRGRREGV